MTTLEDMTKKKAEPSAEAAARAIRSQNAALRPCSVTTTGRCSWFQGERLREEQCGGGSDHVGVVVFDGGSQV